MRCYVAATTFICQCARPEDSHCAFGLINREDPPRKIRLKHQRDSLRGNQQEHPRT